MFLLDARATLLLSLGLLAISAAADRQREITTLHITVYFT